MWKRHRGRNGCGFSIGSETGQNIIEMAFLMPLVLIVLAGVFDLGRVLHTNVVITNAAREAAIAGATKQLSSNALQGLILDEIERAGVEGGTPSITIGYADEGVPPKKTILVDVSYETPMALSFLPFPKVAVHAHAEMVAFWGEEEE